MRQVSKVEPDRARHTVAITVGLDVTDVLFKAENGRHVAALEVAAFCGNDQEDLLGQRWTTVDLRLTPESFDRAKREGPDVPGRRRGSRRSRGSSKWWSTTSARTRSAIDGVALGGRCYTLERQPASASGRLNGREECPWCLCRNPRGNGPARSC
jgi:hypothetical protein